MCKIALSTSILAKCTTAIAKSDQLRSNNMLQVDKLTLLRKVRPACNFDVTAQQLSDSVDAEPVNRPVIVREIDYCLIKLANYN